VNRGGPAQDLRPGRHRSPLGRAAWEGGRRLPPASPTRPASRFRGDPAAGSDRQPAMASRLRDALIDTIVRFQRFAGEERALPWGGPPGTDTPRLRCSQIPGERDQAGEAQQGRPRPRASWMRAWALGGKGGGGRQRGTIVGQLPPLGYSVDWKRERFHPRSGPEQSGGGGLRAPGTEQA